MNAKNIIVLMVLLTFLGSTAAEAFPLFGGSRYYNGSNYGNGSWGHCHHHRHHRHHRW